MISAIGDMIGEAGSAIGGVLDSWNAPQKKKDEVMQVINQLEISAQSAITQAQTEITKAELQQDDKYTKRMRPTVGYFGLIVAVLEALGLRYMLLSWMDVPSEAIIASDSVLAMFWMAWGGVVGVYAVARGFEKVSRMKND